MPFPQNATYRIEALDGIGRQYSEIFTAPTYREAWAHYLRVRFILRLVQYQLLPA